MSCFRALLFHDMEQRASGEFSGQNDFTGFFVDLKPFDRADLDLPATNFAAAIIAFHIPAGFVGKKLP